ncbi:MAG: Sir2 family NAD-dependent protein deacetylase, partial [Mesorhizobium sp.]
MNEDPILPLAKAIRERNAVLFVGAGVSMSVGLPSWEKLIERMASELGLDGARPRDRFQTLAEYYRIK